MTDFESEEPLVSDEMKEIILTTMYSGIGVGICTFGLVSNTVNTIVFAKQGFQETINVSLFAIAISDLASVATLLWVGICLNPLLKTANTPFIPENIHYITGEWPHAISVRISGWLTTIVTVERCLCIIFPLKVKRIVTLTRIKGLVVAVFIVVIASMSPNFYFTRLVWEFFPEENRTFLVQAYTDDKEEIDSIAIYFHSTVPSLFQFFVISTATAILVVNLQRQSKWRQKASAAGNQDKDQQTAMKDKKVVKLVITVAVVFIACLLPHVVAIFYASLDPEFSLMGKRKNFFKITGAFVLTLEAINSSVNIFIYYTMSSKYKLIFRNMFFRDEKDNVDKNEG